MTPPPQMDDEFDDRDDHGDEDYGDDESFDGDELLEEHEDLLADFEEAGDEDLDDDESEREQELDEDDYEDDELGGDEPLAATWAGRQAQLEEQEEPPLEEEPPSEELKPSTQETEIVAAQAVEPAAANEKPATQESEPVAPPAGAPPPHDTAPMPPVHAPPQRKVPMPPPGLTPAEGGIPPGMSVSPALLEALAEGDDAHPPKPRLLARFLAASFVIVASMAAATSISALLFFTDFAQSLNVIPGLDRSELPEAEGAQTILILGSDIRPGDEAGRSDTTMLVRLDSDRDLISLMSLPRDLQVNIPGYGTDRLNAAYSYGGPPLTLETVKELTGLEINHLVNVDFAGFARAVDAIDCVYVDVDRDYYHVNEYGFDQYAEIDIDPGYQRLCGPDALSYVRYRHEDNDIVRGARQQDFLREARAKISPGDIWSNKNEYLDIFTDYTSSDIREAGPLITLLKLFISLRNAQVQKVEFHGDIGDSTSTYVTASQQQLDTAITKFLGEDDDGGSAFGEPTAESAGGGGGGGGGGSNEPDPDAGGGPAMIDTTDSAQAFGGEFAKEVHFPVYAPTQLPVDAEYDDDSHAYGIDAPDKVTYGAYKFVFNRFGPYGVPEYFGVMGTKWKDPPILDNPSEYRSIDGRNYLLFYDSGRLRLVGWKTDEGSYWVNNTLTHSLGEDEMLGIATSLTEIPSPK